MSDLAGSQIGALRFGRLLGRGGMGEVYEAFDSDLERKVAAKVLRSSRRLRESSKQRFVREARTLSRSNHPNVCTIHGFVEREDLEVLVLELIEGEVLSHSIDEGSLSFRRRLEVARSIADVLVKTHREGILHRDLKLDNVMITNDGVVKVLDFGLARSYSDQDPSSLKVSFQPRAIGGVRADDQETMTLEPSSFLSRHRVPAANNPFRPVVIRSRLPEPLLGHRAT